MWVEINLLNQGSCFIQTSARLTRSIYNVNPNLSQIVRKRFCEKAIQPIQEKSIGRTVQQIPTVDRPTETYVALSIVFGISTFWNYEIQKYINGKGNGIELFSNLISAGIVGTITGPFILPPYCLAYLYYHSKTYINDKST